VDPYVSFLHGALALKLAAASAAASASHPDHKLIGTTLGEALGVVDELMARGAVDPADVRWARLQEAPRVRAAYCDADRLAA
jgi:hypothetical protein